MSGCRDNIVENNIIINSTRNLHYDNRMIVGLLDDGWFGDGLTITMSNQVINYSQNEKWVEAFPTYADIIPYTGEITCDPDDKNFIINPYNSIIRNNVTYCVSDYTVGLDYYSSRLYIEDGAAEYLTVENNKFFYNDRSDFPGWHNGDYTMRENAKALALCPDFKHIPFDKMGRVDW